MEIPASHHKMYSLEYLMILFNPPLPSPLTPAAKPNPNTQSAHPHQFAPDNIGSVIGVKQQPAHNQWNKPLA